ncbi:hypothetical protein PVK06_005030 [Gossypium arboreum]|uniref:Uncharacterized protein n=1 Tax=Gossypium arboreum TaxID=29729 RepID=A0ABR0QTJ0_GOSAR|nr:hypothetical protein PVK06_005030 [Gossypium arboreum]
MARVKTTSKTAEPSGAGSAQPKTLFNSAAQQQQDQYWAYVRSRDLALKRSLQKNFTKLMPEFPIFPATLLPFSDAVDEPTQTTIEEPTQPTSEDPRKKASLNIEKDQEEEKDDTATPATTKGKDLVPPLPPVSLTIQDCDIDCLIDKLMKIDNEGGRNEPQKEEMAV